MNVTCVVGARPNYVKAAPVILALEERGVDVRLVNTGQHYDQALAGGIAFHLGMPRPDRNLMVGSGSHAEQTAAVMVGMERELLECPPDALVVAGDVNSTLGAALAAAKLGVPIVHVESGLRSGDTSMPEEINRMVVDRLSDLLLCTCEDAADNLYAEGRHGLLVGNTMIDSLKRLLPVARERAVCVGLPDFILVTLHRPSLVDDPARLDAVMDVLEEASRRLLVIFPAHPRTQQRLEGRRFRPGSHVWLRGALGYLDFLALEDRARLVITDSGGVQEETTALGVPCLTYRDNTERPVTVSKGTNRVVGTDPETLRAAIGGELARWKREPKPPIPLWDGHAGERAANEIVLLYGNKLAVAA